MGRIAVMKAKLDDTNMAVISGVQRFVYRCVSTFNHGTVEKTIDEKGLLMNRWADKLFEADHQITFDESVWHPDDKGAYENIIMLKVRIGNGQSFYVVKIDLRKEYHNCVHIVDESGDKLTNIFNVTFTIQEDKEDDKKKVKGL